MEIRNDLTIRATMIPNEFIDEYMASANGEYVKEYLFLLRHEGEEVTVSMMAEALNHTEADVARALGYWKRLGVLREENDQDTSRFVGSQVKDCAGETGIQESGGRALPAKSFYTPEKVSVLAADEDFSQLLYIAQKYMNKVFTQRECEVFAYLYDGVSIPSELLEYVVEYCVQGGHTSLRYIETVALNWHEKGVRTVDEAKAFASSFSKDSFAVMKAFGLNDRKPGNSERETIDRWFTTYGFSKELVMEACNRTLDAIHSPSFKYADKILSDWKKAGVHTLSDVKKLDERHAGRGKAGRGDVSPGFARRGEEGQKGSIRPASGRQKSSNQFQNFPQRETDYDALVLQQLSEQ